MPDGVGHVSPEAKRKRESYVGEREKAMSTASEALEFNYAGV